MYVIFTFSDKTIRFLYKTGPTKYQNTIITILSENIGHSSVKHAELSATKMRVFYEIIIPFLLFIVPFLLFNSFFNEITGKYCIYCHKKNLFHQNSYNFY